MLRRRKRIFLVIAWPFLALFIAALLVALLGGAIAISSGKFFHPAGSDAVGVFAEATVRSFVHYEIGWKEGAEGSFFPENRLRVHIQGPASGLVRFLIPVEAVVFSKDVKQEETFENLHAFVARLDLKQGEGKTFQFRYRLPPKKPAQNIPYAIQFLPAAGTIRYRVVVKTPDYLEAVPQMLQGTAVRPRLVTVNFGPARSPLSLVSAEFLDNARIAVRFNRALSSMHAGDVLNFSVRDMNAANAEVTDRIFVYRAEVSGEFIILYLRGITFQPAEKYELSVKNIQDKNGMFLSSFPVTAVLAPF